jgi:hypothetical protein
MKRRKERKFCSDTQWKSSRSYHLDVKNERLKIRKTERLKQRRENQHENCLLRKGRNTIATL